MAQLMQILQQPEVNYSKTAAMALLYKYRDGGDSEYVPRDESVDPVTEKPASAEEVLARTQPIPSVETTASSDYTSDSRNVIRPSDNNKRRGAFSVTSPSTDEDAMPVETRRAKRIKDHVDEEDAHRSKRNKIDPYEGRKSARTSPRKKSNFKMKSKTKKFSGSDDLRGFIVPDGVDDFEGGTVATRSASPAKMAWKKQFGGTKIGLLPAKVDPDKVICNTPWIQKLAGGVYVKNLMVLADSNVKKSQAEKEQIAAEIKEIKRSAEKGLLDTTVNRAKAWNEGWAGKETTEVVEFPLDKPSWTAGSRTGYDSAMLDGVEIKVGDTVAIRAEEADEALAGAWFARVISMWYDDSKKRRDEPHRVHVRWFNHGGDTFVGEFAGPKELFLTSLCDELDLSTITGKVKVDKVDIEGPVEEDPKYKEINRYFYRLHANVHSKKAYTTETENPKYEIASLYENDGTDIHIPGEQQQCWCCNKAAQLHDERTPKVLMGEDGQITRLFFEAQQFNIGDCVYIEPKMRDDPYHIGRIIGFGDERDGSRDGGYTVEIMEFRRFNDFHTDYYKEGKYNLSFTPRDERRLYITGRTVIYPADTVAGKCHIVLGDQDFKYKILRDTFYVSDKMRDDARGSRRREDLVPLERTDFVDSCNIKDVIDAYWAPRKEFAKAGQKLRAMDVYAGCGGLTQGLDGAGAIETRWAIEWDKHACETFKLNFPQCKTYCGDVNKILKQAADEEMGLKTKPVIGNDGQPMLKMPRRGEVDFLYGGPPCQDFSGMNRIKREDSFKNGQISSFLSMLDHYKPAYFLLENVRGLIDHKLVAGIDHGTVKFIHRALTSLGYSSQHELYQAAELGSPQQRRRIFFWGARQGNKLPLYPVPTHVFANSATSTHTYRLAQSAPHEAITIGDVLTDMPAFEYDHILEEDDPEEIRARGEHILQLPGEKVKAKFEFGPEHSEYTAPPQTHYQALMRHELKPNVPINRHVTLAFGPAIIERICATPIRHKRTNCFDQLPKYLTEGTRNSANKGRLRLRYGRFAMNEVMHTCLTDMQPSSHATLHPLQRRLYSVREWARMQAFPDWFLWDPEMHPALAAKQIGNAVNGMHGKALGECLFDVVYAKWVEEGKPILIRDAEVELHRHEGGNQVRFDLHTFAIPQKGARKAAGRTQKRKAVKNDWDDDLGLKDEDESDSDTEGTNYEELDRRDDESLMSSDGEGEDAFGFKTRGKKAAVVVDIDDDDDEVEVEGGDDADSFEGWQEYDPALWGADA